MSDWGISMHAAFLTERHMRVKVGNIISDKHHVTGGAVQGSVLGVLDHNAVIESLDEDIAYQDVYKYVDDLTVDEEIPQDIAYFIEHGEIDTHIYKPPDTQKSMIKLEQACQDRGLKINDKKTQLLSISAGRNNTKCCLTLKDGSTIYSAEMFKLLGFMFSNTPNVHEHINHIVNRATSRSFVIRNLANLDADKTKLRNVYCYLTRSVMEYSSVTFGSMMTKYDKNRLETIQKKCLRSIYGYGLSYEELLEKSGLETLENRRDKALAKFANKALLNLQFEHWFPLNKNRTGRHGKTFEEKYAKSDRLYNSPLFKMRRILNETPNNDQTSNPKITDLSYLFNAPGGILRLSNKLYLTIAYTLPLLI